MSTTKYETLQKKLFDLSKRPDDEDKVRLSILLRTLNTIFNQDFKEEIHSVNANIIQRNWLGFFDTLNSNSVLPTLTPTQASYFLSYFGTEAATAPKSNQLIYLLSALPTISDERFIQIKNFLSAEIADINVMRIADCIKILVKSNLPLTKGNLEKLFELAKNKANFGALKNALKTLSSRANGRQLTQRRVDILIEHWMINPFATADNLVASIDTMEQAGLSIAASRFSISPSNLELLLEAVHLRGLSILLQALGKNNLTQAFFDSLIKADQDGWLNDNMVANEVASIIADSKNKKILTPLNLSRLLKLNVSQIKQLNELSKAIGTEVDQKTFDLFISAIKNLEPIKPTNSYSKTINSLSETESSDGKGKGKEKEKVKKTEEKRPEESNQKFKCLVNCIAKVKLNIGLRGSILTYIYGSTNLEKLLYHADKIEIISKIFDIDSIMPMTQDNFDIVIEQVNNVNDIPSVTNFINFASEILGDTNKDALSAYLKTFLKMSNAEQNAINKLLHSIKDITGKDENTLKILMNLAPEIVNKNGGCLENICKSLPNAATIIKPNGWQMFFSFITPTPLEQLIMNYINESSAPVPSITVPSVEDEVEEDDSQTELFDNQGKKDSGSSANTLGDKPSTSSSRGEEEEDDSQTESFDNQTKKTQEVVPIHQGMNLVNQAAVGEDEDTVPSKSSSS